MSIKMVALDLDGTTLNSAGDITARTADALNEAARCGVHIVVSTGRAYTSLPEVIKEVKGIQYAITSNGAHINDMATGETIYDDYLSERAVERIAELARELETDIEVFIDCDAFADKAYLDYMRDHGCEFRRAEYVLKTRKPAPDIIEMLLENKDRIDNVNFCFRTLELLEESRATVMAIPESTVTSSFANNLEVGGPNTSKKTALIELMKRLGVEREELMCCGDAPNDIDMIEFAGIGVAVGNAWGGTKDHADYIAPSNDDDGVAEAIERFVLER